MHDIIVISETWKDSKFSIELPGYHTFNLPRLSRHAKAKRASGGFVIFVRKEYSNMVKLEYTRDTVVWFRVKNVQASDIFLGFVYLPPEGSPFSTDEDFDVIHYDIERYAARGKVTVGTAMRELGNWGILYHTVI